MLERGWLLLLPLHNPSPVSSLRFSFSRCLIQFGEPIFQDVCQFISKSLAYKIPNQINNLPDDWLIPIFKSLLLIIPFFFLPFSQVTKLDDLSPIIFLNRTKAALNCGAGSMEVNRFFFFTEKSSTHCHWNSVESNIMSRVGTWNREMSISRS